MKDRRIAPAFNTPADDERKAAFFQVLASIPPGRVTSYGRIAELAGLGRGARLVGRWLGQLPEGTHLPWHRVLNSQGKLSLGADTPSGREQRERLAAEGILVRNDRVNLRHYAWPEPPAPSQGQA
ncbi:MGMT family protein [Halopseudomonas aestusnigri]|uniref:MGMT family protein n=1 Tax=Halopseudomonas aestusnigri TaxID=857252 RepID=UPI0028C04D9C|nr:MGMT family protein [Halopseudomonas aestusnigri]